uniref:glutathione transferase n=1 Tax=Glaciozyma antarctica TaxID=105987 RepID=I1E4C1_9BASI|nr:glutathione S-transferase [Glaciozyma antarctica]
MAQFTLYTHGQGPNGWKVVFALRALGLTYESKYLDFATAQQKEASFVTIQPNGRIPCLVDHQNGDFAIWESDAILLYIVDTYDKEHKISVTDPKEKAQTNQWLFFQSSGQGAYFGQAAHFKLFAPEKIPYGVTRYTNEVARVSQVMEDVLAKQPFLVGNKVTIADLSFIPWNTIAFQFLLPDGVDPKTAYPNLWAWHQKLVEIPYVAAGLAERTAAMAPKA